MDYLSNGLHSLHSGVASVGKGVASLGASGVATLGSGVSSVTSGVATMGSKQLDSLLVSIATFTETEEEATQRVGPTPAMMQAAELLYKRIAALNEPRSTMRKADLVQATRGDFKTFERMDQDSDGIVTLVEFFAWIETSHSERRAKKRGSGDRWIKTLLGTLEQGVLEAETRAGAGESEAEAAQRTGPIAAMSTMAGHVNPSRTVAHCNPNLGPKSLHFHCPHCRCRFRSDRSLSGAFRHRADGRYGDCQPW